MEELVYFWSEEREEEKEKEGEKKEEEKEGREEKGEKEDGNQRGRRREEKSMTQWYFIFYFRQCGRYLDMVSWLMPFSLVAMI